METSTISGYRESFGGFDMSLQELERLEMQASTVNCVAKVGKKYVMWWYVYLNVGLNKY